jgi:protein-S-isoprenylcysteine O-methyltransferase Ste14
MNHDQTFRAVLVGVFVVILPIGIYFRLRSQATREKLDRRQEGLFILATLGPLGASFWLGLFAWMIDPAWMAWSSGALLMLAISLIAANWFLFVIGILVFCLLIIRTRTEEENLIARFGNSYRRYILRTGRFLPRRGLR